MADQTAQSATPTSKFGIVCCSSAAMVDHLDPRIVILLTIVGFVYCDRWLPLVHRPLRGQCPVPRWLE